MLKLLTLFLLVVCFKPAHAQKIVIMPERKNELTIGLTNEISIAVENSSCKNLSVTVDNGKIEGSMGNYTWFPIKPGIAHIRVFVTNKGVSKEIGSREFRVHYPPDPTPFIGISFRGGLISKNVLKEQYFLRLVLENVDYTYMASVDSFKLSIARGDSFLVRNLRNETGIFSKEITAALEQIEVGDIVVFKEIYYSYFGFPKKLNPIVATVTNGIDVFK